MSWWKRARAGTLPVSVIDGAPRKAFRCHYCHFSDDDAETTFAHMMEPHINRRIKPQRVVRAR